MSEKRERGGRRNNNFFKKSYCLNRATVRFRRRETVARLIIVNKRGGNQHSEGGIAEMGFKDL